MPLHWERTRTSTLCLDLFLLSRENAFDHPNYIIPSLYSSVMIGATQIMHAFAISMIGEEAESDVHN
jgi:hypothetical protein